MSSLRVTTNFRDSNGVDLGDELITKDYLMSVYPEIGQQIGIPPELWTWGYGNFGRLGNATTTTNNSTPVTTFAGGTNWKQVNAASTSSAAIKTDGTLWTWGYSASGKLGNAVITGNISTPVTTFSGGTNWKQVSCGTIHTAAIKTDGTLWAWGNPFLGRIGNAVVSNTSISTPVTTFAGGTNWKQVSAGGSHTAAIKTDGTLWTWGYSANGRLGNAAIAGNISTPVTTFAGGTNWKQVSCGETHTVAIKTDGTLWVWGNGGFGQLGNGVTTGNISTPVTTFSGGTNWKQLSSGFSHTAAIKTDGTLWIWGQNIFGELGTNNSTNRSTPVTTFAGGTNWKQVSSGNSNTVAIKTDGTLWTWGFGNNGQLGNASLGRSTPVTTFAGGNNWKQVKCGNSFVSAIRSVDFAGF